MKVFILLNSDKASLIPGHGGWWLFIASKSNSNTIEYLMNRLQNKNGKPPFDIIHNSDSVNNNTESSVYSKRGKYATLPRTQKETINTW